MIMASLAKKRKMNFSEREVEIIVEEIERHKHSLVNHFNAGVTHLAKNNAWMDILTKVNAVTTCPRELSEVKKKWSDMKTEVRRKVAQARHAIEGGGEPGGGGGGSGTPSAPVILTAMQQRICNLLGEATIISLPAEDSLEDHQHVTTVTLTQGQSHRERTRCTPSILVRSSSLTCSVPHHVTTLTQALPTEQVSVCDETKQLNETESFLEEVPGVVEYCTTTVGGDPVAETPPTVDMLGGGASAGSPPALSSQSHAKPQELKSRIALNSARLLQEQRVTNVHVRQIAVHLEGLNDTLAAVRRSQEAQAYAQERQAQALEGTQAALLALVQMLRPALKDLRKSLSGGSSSDLANAGASASTGSTAALAGSGDNDVVSIAVSDAVSITVSGGSGTEDQTGAKTPPPQDEETQ